TGEFPAGEHHGPDGAQALADEILVLKPREILVPAGDAPGEPAPTLLSEWPMIAATGLPITPVGAAPHPPRPAPSCIPRAKPRSSPCPRQGASCSGSEPIRC